MNGIYEIKLNIGDDESRVFKIAKRKFGADAKEIKILKKSLDARNKRDIRWIYSVYLSDEVKDVPPLEKIITAERVVIVGGGPAGLFCALRLIERGIKPVIIERGEPVEERKRSITEFINKRKLNVNSNVQFGEGGAGAFSDGKLNTQTKDGFNKDVLNIFHKFGAPKEITYLNKPHVGSDNLYNVLIKIREYIISCGGEYLFNSLFYSFKQDDGELKSVMIKNVVSGEEKEIKTRYAVLALGHSSYDTFKMLDKNGVFMEPRPIAVGVRIEHSASAIGFAQYGEAYKSLPCADYKLVSHAHERTVFTFCMCPGGVVIPAASEEGGVVTNGMSLFARNGENSNSALMVQLLPNDIKDSDLFAGIRFRRELEQRAFLLGGGDYSAPVQLYGDFAKDKLSSEFKSVKPTYGAGVKFAPLCEVLPPIVTEALKCAIPDMDRRLKGFGVGDAVLTGVETRFTSPIKIVRCDSGDSVSVKGLYPCGEVGYSGGITSSAADGMRTAEKIFEKLKNA